MMTRFSNPSICEQGFWRSNLSAWCESKSRRRARQLVNNSAGQLARLLFKSRPRIGRTATHRASCVSPRIARAATSLHFSPLGMNHDRRHHSLPVQALPRIRPKCLWRHFVQIYHSSPVQTVLLERCLKSIWLSDPNLSIHVAGADILNRQEQTETRPLI